MRKEYDFSTAKRAKNISHLARLQAESKSKTCITIMLDNFVIEAFRELADAEEVGYQTLINQTLRQCLAQEPMDEETVRRVVREELAAYK
jgi:uncharacterized protein (DUF4415 family)